MLLALLACTAAGASLDDAEETTCNYSRQRWMQEEPSLRQLKASSAAGGAQANLTLLPQTDGELSPASLDGSPYGLFIQRSSTGSKKWTIMIQGGGWCYDLVDCFCRSKMHYGTSSLLPATFRACQCMNPLPNGTMDKDCNCLFLPYLDGASFAGFRAEPVAVPEGGPDTVPPNATLHFRGIKNLDRSLDYALAHGMADAAEVVLTGVSAGGLSVFLHADRVAARVRAGAAGAAPLKAAPQVGYFLDHDNFAHSRGATGPNTPGWSNVSSGLAADYTTWMAYVHTMQNLTSGSDGGLMAACEAKHRAEPWLCFMAPHMQDVVKTPLFMFNGRFDAWQLANILQVGDYKHVPTLPAERAGVLQYGADFLTQLAPFVAPSSSTTEQTHGGFITSCVCHGCPWADLVLKNKTSYEWFADWYYGKTPGGEASMHIDHRLPDGNGSLVGGAYVRCNAWAPGPPPPSPRPPAPPGPPGPSHRDEPCPAHSGKGCATCIAAKDSRCPGRWCNQSCVHTSQKVGRGAGGDCFPADWWDSQRAKYPKASCVGETAGCSRTCGGPPPSPPSPPRPPSPPPSPPGPLPPADIATANYLTDYPQAKCLDGSPGYYYHRPAPAGPNATKWVLHIQGGGWCDNAASCQGRTARYLGSSRSNITGLPDRGPFTDILCPGKGAYCASNSPL